jgi:hypothetical protein
MEQLNRHNYEVFYLDFLEGNLNEEGTAQLLRFLDENPDLKLEDENFEIIGTSIIQLDDSFKNDLKQLDFELDEVNQTTINSFLIAQFEHLLSTKKEKEVEAFLIRQPNYKIAQKQIKSTFLVPDLSINYPDKKGLKKSETRYLWPIISSIAAILVILFLVMNPTSIPSEGLQKALVVPEKESRKTQPLILSKVMNSPIHTVKKESVKSTNTSSNLLLPENEILLLAQIDTISTNIEVVENELITFLYEIEDKDQDVAQVTNIPVIKKRSVSTEAFDCVSALDKYPIESLTNNLSTLIKKQVEFKTCKNTKSNKTGFYLKIGKFIISKQTT